MTSTPSIRDVLDFWFLPLDHPEHGKLREVWWQGPAEFDAEIRERFSPAFERAIEGGLDHWRQSPDGALALILLCDQFPRNMHRRSAHAFAGDGTAMETARLALARFYPAAFNPFNDPEMMKYAIEHRDIIARFGRFPHRNDVLGRVCTDEELEYLKNANRFGQ
jgi:uncharacterized protein (DUF924 family)